MPGSIRIMKREGRAQKMRKKIVSVALAGAMVLSLAACGGGNTNNAGNETTAAPTESTTADAASVEASKEAKKDQATAKAPDNDIVIAVQQDTTSMDPHVVPTALPTRFSMRFMRPC